MLDRPDSALLLNVKPVGGALLGQGHNIETGVQHEKLNASGSTVESEPGEPRRFKWDPVCLEAEWFLAICPHAALLQDSCF